MIISIQSKVVKGPWGGGNLFAKNLINYLKANNFEVISHLYNRKIDLILMTDPLKNSSSTNYSFNEIKNYKKFINPNVKIVHRINECDERKNTNYVNNEIIKSNYVADKTVFVSNWLKNLYESIGLENNNSVILSGSDRKIFNNLNKKKWDRKTNLKLVTHHWGTNVNKGFNIYSFLDEAIYINSIKNVEFTYIGNLPKNFQFKATNHIQPLEGKKLANELKKHHIYLTASINEPSGNHHIEGAQCGLPILYLNSGGVVEYCQKYGVPFDNQNDFLNSLEEISEKYEIYFSKVLEYPNDSNLMSFSYMQLFNQLNEINEENKHNQNVKFNLYILKYFLNKIKFKLI